NVRQGGFNLNTMRFVKASGTAIEPGQDGAPRWDGLFPNPTTGLTTLDLHLPRSSEVTIEVLDIMGRRVLDVPLRRHPPGKHRIELDLPLASGTYVLAVTITD